MGPRVRGDDKHQRRLEPVNCPSPAGVGARGLPVGIIVKRRRPDLAVEASRVARTDTASPAPRGSDGANLPRSPWIVPVGAHAAGIVPAGDDSIVLLPQMVPATCLGLTWRDRGDQDGCRGDSQDQTPDRNCAHSYLRG